MLMGLTIRLNRRNSNQFPMAVSILYYACGFQTLQGRFGSFRDIIDGFRYFPLCHSFTSKREFLYDQLTDIPAPRAMSFTQLLFCFIMSDSRTENLHCFPKSFFPRLDEHSLARFFFAGCNCGCPISLQLNEIGGGSFHGIRQFQAALAVEFPRVANVENPATAPILLSKSVVNYKIIFVAWQVGAWSDLDLLSTLGVAVAGCTY
jgi:hypothetical protein